jgi:hypothetical protein
MTTEEVMSFKKSHIYGFRSEIYHLFHVDNHIADEACLTIILGIAERSVLEIQTLTGRSEEDIQNDISSVLAVFDLSNLDQLYRFLYEVYESESTDRIQTPLTDAFEVKLMSLICGS